MEDKKKDILILSNGPTDGFDDTPLAVEKKYYINFTEQQNNIFLACLIMEQAVTYLLHILLHICYIFVTCSTILYLNNISKNNFQLII